MAVACLPASNITTNSATLNGVADQIPANNFIRFAFGTDAGGPYNNFTPPVPGDTSFGQAISANITQLIPEVQYYYVVQHLDTDADTVLNQSGQCTFKTLAYNPRCEVLAFDETSTTIRVCADYVAPDQELQFVWSSTPGGPYNNVAGAVAGTNTLNQCADFVLPLGVCQVIYAKARVTNVPASYEIDWQYSHGNRAGVPETTELRIGPEATYPAGQTLVDTDVNTVANSWNRKSGTYVVPLNINQLHMGFVATTPPGSVGNFLDRCSIVLRRVLPSPMVIGEQLLNPSFEVPVQPAGVSFVPEGGAAVWQTTDPTNVLEYWAMPVVPAPDDGNQFVELNAFNAGELFQVVNLAVGMVDSEEECISATFNLDCLPATNIDCVSATINGEQCGLLEHYSYQFQYSTGPLGPWNSVGAVTFSPGPSTVDVPISAGLVSLDPNTQYFYRIVLLDPEQEVIGTSEVCDFTTLDCISWCGGWFPAEDCVFVDTANDDYFNCNNGI